MEKEKQKLNDATEAAGVNPWVQGPGEEASVP